MKQQTRNELGHNLLEHRSLREMRERVIYGGWYVAAFLVPLFLLQALATLIFPTEDIFVPQMVKWSLCIDLLLVAIIFAFILVNLYAKKLGEQAIKIHYRSSLIFMYILAAVALMHMHFLGTLHSMQTILILAVSAAFCWYVERRAAFWLFVTSNIAVIILLFLEACEVLPYAPFLQKGSQLRDTFLDPRMIAMNGAVYFVINGTLIAVFLYYRKSLEQGRIQLQNEMEGRIQLQKQLAQSQKMETVGTLASGIAHDFNNILQIITNSTKDIREELAEDDPLQQDITTIESAGGRARDLVRQILAFSQSEVGQPQWVDIDEIVRDSVKFLRATLPTTIDIDLHIDPGKHLLWADPALIHLMIINLGTNAYQAAVDVSGQIEVVIQLLQYEKPVNISGHEIKPGHYIVLSVEDNGAGMDEQTLAKAFEPFFTTQPVGKGSGLGLSVVHGIVKDLKGQTIIQSEPGKGTIVQIYLPYSEEVPEQKSSEEDSEPENLGKSIIFVDDEEEVVKTTHLLLDKKGYSVVATTSANKALAQIEESPEQFYVAVVDLAMPEMSGVELAKRIKQINHSMRIVLSTGNLGRMKMNDEDRSLFDIILTKPYDFLDLIQAIAE